MEELEYLYNKVYTFKLKNGLKVYIIPNKNEKTFNTSLYVNYGSNDVNFDLNEKKYKTNYGIAHFLEHKMFESEELDLFKYFSQYGASTNAGTSYYYTKYYVTGINNYLECTNKLLDTIINPYITDSNVKKEQGIIEQEIKMYSDDPIENLNDEYRRLLFNNLEIKEKISGEVKDIYKITKEELLNCYNTFYVPNNMISIISGNINKDKIYNLIIKHDINKINKKLFKKNKVEEIDSVRKEYKLLNNKNIFIPKVKYGFKINRNKFSIKNDYKLDLYLNIIRNTLFSQTSIFYEKIRKENIVNLFESNLEKYENFYSLEFTAESERADILKDMIDEVLENINIDSKELERKKKVLISREIYRSENSKYVATNIYLDLYRYNKLLENKIDIIKKLNMKELNKVIKELDLENSTFLLMMNED